MEVDESAHYEENKDKDNIAMGAISGRSKRVQYTLLETKNNRSFPLMKNFMLSKSE